ncbi:hypothetical protein [Modestobacter sp. NPDC049651]|uniref:hypothetical protein n=1 Tax=unclassified Modestobacter TaxID=2643866 RepID=UPI0033E1005C
MDPTADGDALWPTRYLTGDRLVVVRGNGATGAPPTPAPAWPGTAPSAAVEGMAAVGRWWHQLDGGQKAVLVVLLVLLTGGLGLVVPLAGVLAQRELEQRGTRPAALPPGRPPSPEAVLASWDTLEARVAAAAGRAWAETQREPSWHSPHLAANRAAFDGAAEVDAIVDLALRIQRTRYELGPRPAGPAAEYWDRQRTALDRAAHQLGRRADALIRHRDQAAALSVELRHLADLERLERSAVAVDDLTLATAAGGPGEPRLAQVADDIAAVRRAMTDLVDLMTRTRAPLVDPPPPLPERDRPS